MLVNASPIGGDEINYVTNGNLRNLFSQQITLHYSFFRTTFNLNTIIYKPIK